MNTKIMRDASYLLPPPGGEVVRDLLDSYDTLLARHNDLVEKVAWDKECWNVEMSVQHKINSASQHTIDAYFESDSTYKAARAEVDRLIATADCKGEGWKKNR